MSASSPTTPPDPIPHEDRWEFVAAPEGDGRGIGRHANGSPEPHRCTFLAFDTVIWLQAFGNVDQVERAFMAAMDACRRYERLFSRTLPHSDISRLNGAGGTWTAIDPATYELLSAALGYCRKSQGLFDITIGPVVALWDFHEQRVPNAAALEEARRHVNWRVLDLAVQRGADAGGDRCLARLGDSRAAVDVGGIAKGHIADKLTTLLADHGLESFIVNLGGNVVARGAKPDGTLWRVGIRDPRRRSLDHTVGTVPLRDASMVTSGLTERCFLRHGTWYHHILDPLTGMPAATDLLSVSVVAPRSLDAEGFSTTLLALGREKALAFAQEEPAITAIYCVDPEGTVVEG